MKALAAVARTHPGRVRTNNEDAVVCEPGRGLFAVIDGMGGQNAGEVAAEIARDALLAGTDPVAAIADANQRIVDQAAANPHQAGMGCVLTVAMLAGESLRLFHVGDTRAWLASATGCEQLTRDHTLVEQRQEDLGLSDAQARQLSGRNQVTRDVGGKARQGTDWIDTSDASFAPGDLLLLSSDGLHDLVSDAEVFGLLGEARRSGKDVGVLAEQLIELALDRGGKDNVSVVLVRRLEAPSVPRSVLGFWSGLLLGLIAGVGIGLPAGMGWQASQPAPVQEAVAAPPTEVPVEGASADDTAAPSEPPEPVLDPREAGGTSPGEIQ